MNSHEAEDGLNWSSQMLRKVADRIDEMCEGEIDPRAISAVVVAIGNIGAIVSVCYSTQLNHLLNEKFTSLDWDQIMKDTRRDAQN